MSSTYQRLTVRVDEATGICQITLNRPEKRNAIDPLMVDELTDALAWADADDRVRVGLLRGAGRDFCAGLDLTALAEMKEAQIEEHLADADALGDLVLLMRRVRMPLIAGVHGNALAGGCGLATACDIILASDDATFGYPEVKVGFVPAMVMAILRRAVGEKRAIELALTGRSLDAHEAHRLGLVHHVFPAAEFEEQVEAYATELAERSATALALTKRLLYETDAASFEAAIRAGAEMNALARQTEDFRQGVEKFLKRKRS
ncbi:MAG: enoyl-CoA hydratase/isomerase family protein [Gemmatimonadetes bacterium]|nr:enoyl-CoA hydratase/isomerase family protein [Gemmatimonadota bacterium]